VCVLSVFGLYSPARLTRMVRGAVERPWGIYLAVIVRLALGLALIVAAPGSRFPAVFEVLGWVALAAAVALVFLGRERLRSLVGWVDRLPRSLVRSWLVFGAAFGGFLVYGVR